ncbi:MAG: alpha-2-macroglobulin family protein [Alphaproteobacteria bacterium]|nr:alpha-2-macroglobulin family protein [Alphaproteobacteria bacterium]
MKRIALIAAAAAGVLVVALIAAWQMGLFAPGEPLNKAGVFSGLVPATTPAQQAASPEFAFRRVEIDTTKPQAEACLVFTRSLDESGKTHYQDYFSIEPKTAVAAHVAGQRLCLGGLDFNKTYQVALKLGLPAASGEKLKIAETVAVELRDKPALVRFSGGIILPRENSDGVPVTTVNVAKLDLKVIRVGDRLLSQLESGVLDQTALYRWNEEQIADNQGSTVWTGSMDVASTRNESVVTLIPIDQVLKDRKPGAYVLIASDAAKKKDDEDYQPVAAQWVIDSDIGLTTFEGGSGLAVFARSYASAKPISGVKLSLVARNNNVLANAVTDDVGRANFAAGFFRGKGGDEPVAVMAYGDKQDFTFLDLRRPVFDLTDRGVGGRPAPGPVDAYLYTDRGVYRPGETVRAIAMLRDRLGAAADAPLTLVARRPDGMEAARTTLAGAALKAGSAYWPVAIGKSAPHGRWQIAAYVDPKADPVGRVQFDVADFVPQRLKVTLTPEEKVLRPGATLDVRAETRVLYGAPASGLSGDAEARITKNPVPFAAYKGYSFGRVEDSFEDVLVALNVPQTNAQGVTQVSGQIGELADTTLPLKAVVRVSIHEPGGRTTDRTMEIPIRTADVMLAIRPAFVGDSVAENTKAGFEVIAVNGDGARIARGNLHYNWTREETNYQWYQDQGQWKYQAVTRDRLITSGEFSVSAGAPAKLAQAMAWGRYRLTITDPQSGASASYRYYSGWAANAAGDRPDRIPVAADKPAYKVGETAHITIKPPSDGRALVVVASDRIYSSQLIRSPAAGATIDIPVSADWGAGAYVLVTHYRGLSEANAREPVRAIGVVWLGIDNSARTLGIQMAVPKKISPRQKISIPVTVTGLAAGESAYVTLSAVDEGILQLTEFQSPDPAGYYFGKRRLGVGMRDDYGRLIKPEKGAIGSLREGGDRFGGRPLAVVPTRTVALFSGLVTVGPGGKATIPADVPDFNGELRLMAVAFTADKMGHADRALTVRDPVVADLVLPRFLAPGDHAAAALNLDNVEGKPGSYSVSLSTTGPAGFDGHGRNVTLSRALKAGERALVPVALEGNGIGIAKVALTLTGPGLKITHSWPIEVRSPQRDVAREEVARLGAGETYKATSALVRDLVPSTAHAALAVTATAPGYGNVAGQLRWLDKYPYGCLEQTVSRAMPLLYFNDVAASAGIAGDSALRGRIQDAVDSVLDMQNYSGDFGMWGAGGTADAWVSVFALDFLTQAKDKNYTVPAEALRRGAQWLRGTASSDSGNDAVRAYAFYVLAEQAGLNLSDLRYFSDTRGPEMKTAIAAALTGAAAAQAGDNSRATVNFRRARDLLMAAKPAAYGHSDYGSLTRDLAATTALAIENGAADLVPALLTKSRDVDMRLQDTTTQEKAWILRAAYALSKQKVPLSIAVNGKPAAESAGAVRLSPSLAQLNAGISLLNQGGAPVWRTSSATGAPVSPLPARADGLSLTKTVWTMAGQPADLANLKQNQRVIVVLSGRMENNLLRQIGVIDLLPAGLEIEMPLKGDDAKAYSFLSTLTDLSMTDVRDDRFVAALTLGWPADDRWSRKVEHPEFHIAYIARAVTAGRFVMPAATAEDMYAPGVAARTRMGTVTISPAR